MDLTARNRRPGIAALHASQVSTLDGEAVGPDGPTFSNAPSAPVFAQGLRDGHREHVNFVRDAAGISTSMVLDGHAYGRIHAAVLHRSRSRRSREPFPARHARCCSFGTAGCNLGLQVLPEPRDPPRAASESTAWRPAPIPETIATVAAAAHGCASVGFTYNDPVIFHESAHLDTEARLPRGDGRAHHGGGDGSATSASSAFCSAQPGRSSERRWTAANIDRRGSRERSMPQADRLADNRPGAGAFDRRTRVHETDCWVVR